MADNGLMLGILYEDMLTSLETLHNMASSLGAVIRIDRQEIIGRPALHDHSHARSRTPSPDWAGHIARLRGDDSTDSSQDELDSPYTADEKRANDGGIRVGRYAKRRLSKRQRRAVKRDKEDIARALHAAQRQSIAEENEQKGISQVVAEGQEDQDNATLPALADLHGAMMNVSDEVTHVPPLARLAGEGNQHPAILQAFGHLQDDPIAENEQVLDVPPLSHSQTSVPSSRSSDFSARAPPSVEYIVTGQSAVDAAEAARLILRRAARKQWKMELKRFQQERKLMEHNRAMAAAAGQQLLIGSYDDRYMDGLVYLFDGLGTDNGGDTVERVEKVEEDRVEELLQDEPEEPCPSPAFVDGSLPPATILRVPKLDGRSDYHSPDNTAPRYAVECLVYYHNDRQREDAYIDKGDGQCASTVSVPRLNGIVVKTEEDDLDKDDVYIGFSFDGLDDDLSLLGTSLSAGASHAHHAYKY